ncbi:DUF4062 domain-containing protein [Mucilaginibacter sp. AW1-3]
MKKKIYISSTFRDLAAYRQKAIEAIQFLLDYFALVRIMEYMMPGSKQPILTECLQNVDDCDIYILIIGNSYGTIESGTGLSYTHNEYLRAKEGDKLVIVLVADDTSNDLANIAGDSAVGYESFKNLVTNENSYLKFRSPDHFVSQLLLALYRPSDQKWDLQDNVKLKCDRYPQYLGFRSSLHPDQLSTYIILCKNHDKPAYFADRIAKYEIGLGKEYLQYIKPGYILGSSNNFESQRLRFITHLSAKFIAPTDPIPSNITECLKTLTAKKVNNLFVHFYMDKNDASDKKTLHMIKRLWEEFDQACKELKFKAFLILAVIFPNEDAIDESLIKSLRHKAITVLDPLPLIGCDEIETWLKEYVTDQNVSINKVQDYLFDKKTQYNMDELYDKMDELYNIIS